MIMHCVFCNIRADVPPQTRADLFSALADLSASLSGFIGFNSGPNLDFEQMSPDYSDGFVIRFRSASDLQRYADHPEHVKLGAQLCALCVDGAKGLIVFDLSCAD